MMHIVMKGKDPGAIRNLWHVRCIYAPYQKKYNAFQLETDAIVYDGKFPDGHPCLFCHEPINLEDKK